MTAIIYLFKVKPDQAENFLKAWRELTILIYENKNSLGSRLHKQDNTTYIAYAQWPDRYTWDNSSEIKLPEDANDVRNRMRNACEKIETLFELELVDDLLKTKIKG